MHTLSGGQKRRLDFALALSATRARLPRRADHRLRPRRAAQRLGDDRSPRDLGKTVLLTTHYLDEAQALADRVAIIKDGRILAEGPPRLGAGGAPLPGRLADGDGPRRSTRRTTRPRCCTS